MATRSTCRLLVHVLGGALLMPLDASAQLFLNSDFETGTMLPCDCAADYTCQNDAGRVVDGVHPVYTPATLGCVVGTTSYTSPLGANSGTGYIYFYAGADQLNTPDYFFAGGEEVELCVWYSGPPPPATPGQNTAASHFKFGVDGAQVGPNVLVPAGTGWTQHCFTVTMTPGSHVFNILSGNAAQYTIWFDDFDVVLVDEPPCAVEIVGGPSICPGGSLTLEVLSATGTDFFWSTGDVGPTAEVFDEGTYWVEVWDDCGISTDTIVVTFLDLDDTFLGNDTTLCAGSTLLLDATTPGSTYFWQDGSDGPTFLVDEPGSYFVDVENNCGFFFAFITVFYEDPVILDLGDDQILCEGNEAFLDASTDNASYLWSDGTTESFVLVGTSGLWWVEVTTGCTTVSDTVDVIFIPNEEPSIGNDTTLCTGSTLLLDATSPGANYFWLDGTTDPTYLVTEPGFYFVDVENACGFFFVMIDVAYTDAPALDLGSDQFLCAGSTLVLDATTPGATYLWNDGSTEPTLTVSDGGTWSVDVTSLCGVITDAVLITSLPIPQVDLGPDTALCQGSNLILDVTTVGSTYLWQNGATGATFTVTGPGAYSVTVVNACGSATDNIAIGLQDPPFVELGNDTILCTGNVLLLDATSPGATYQWSTGSDQPTLGVSQTGTYIVQVTVPCGSMMDQVTVTFAQPPTLELGPDTVLCENTLLELDISVPTASYLWQDGSTAPTYAIGSPGTYWATVSTVCGTVSDTLSVDFIPIPVIDLGVDTTLCPDGSLVLDATTSGASYLWNTGSTAPIITVNDTGTYVVAVSVSCATLLDSILVDVLPVPEIRWPRDTLLCQAPYLLLDVTFRESEYLWQDGSTAPTFLVEEAGVYRVQVTNRCGSDEQALVVNTIDCRCIPFVPNAFTPNNDGDNDQFHPVFACPLEKYELLIYNRWGELVYTTKDPGLGWDGSYGGAISQDGVYVYALEYRTEDNAEGKLRGHVTLLR